MAKKLDKILIGRDALDYLKNLDKEDKEDKKKTNDKKQEDPC